MLYLDEPARLAFHKTPALLQVICTTLEGLLTEASLQLKVIDTDKHLGMHMVMLQVDEADEEVLIGCVNKLNKLFTRSDDSETCVVEDIENNLITIRATDSSDLMNLH